MLGRLQFPKQRSNKRERTLSEAGTSFTKCWPIIGTFWMLLAPLIMISVTCNIPAKYPCVLLAHPRRSRVRRSRQHLQKHQASYHCCQSACLPKASLAMKIPPLDIWQQMYSLHDTGGGPTVSRRSSRSIQLHLRSQCICHHQPLFQHIIVLPF